MIKLRDRRFPVSEVECPRCGKYALEDNWPPNYYLSSYGDKSEYHHTNIKYVCPLCKISFVIESKVEIDIRPLVEMDGIWLTPHDVWTENYKKEHGEYPNESYS